MRVIKNAEKGDYGSYASVPASHFIPYRTQNICEISGSDSSEYEDGCLLGFCAVQSGRSLLTRLRGACCLHHLPDDASTFETSVEVCHKIPEDSHLHT
jgi:hypothetical protein